MLTKSLLVQDSNMISNKTLGKLVKASLFIIFLVLYISLYLIQELREYSKGRTTISSTFQEREKFPLPTILICMDPGIKPSMKEKYGYNQFYRFKDKDDYKVTNMTMWEFAEEISYAFNRDFNLTFKGSIFGKKETYLKNGYNLVNR